MGLTIDYRCITTADHGLLGESGLLLNINGNTRPRTRINFVAFDFVNHKAIYKQLPGVYKSMIKASREAEGLPEGQGVYEGPQ